ncbi:MAG: hypothetical protein DMF63_15040 [Acidobacteria bacterium]|nr:MAG: hypothetical protein DMF63_15040 [Acidobacteriota bacterium]
MSAKHEKAQQLVESESFDAAEATALQAGTPAFQSHPPSVTNDEHRTMTPNREPRTTIDDRRSTNKELTSVNPRSTIKYAKLTS